MQNYSAYTQSTAIPSGQFYAHINEIVGWRQQFVFAPTDDNVSWRQEFLASLQTLRRSHNNLNIMFSGGGDSLMTSMAFMSAGITDVHHSVWVFTDQGNIMHSRELLCGLKHLSKHNLKHTIHTVEIQDFFDAWCDNPQYGKYTCLELDRALQLYMLANTDSSWYNIVNEPTPSLTIKANKYYLRNTFDQMLTVEFMKEFAIPGISRIYTHTPVLMSAWLHGQEMQQLMHDDAIGYSKSLPQMTTGWNRYKYLLYEKLFGFPVCEYQIPKSTIQMWNNKKYLLKWHQLMDQGKLPRRSVNPKMEIPYQHLHDSWSTQSDTWFDYKDYCVETIDGPWHTTQGIQYGQHAFPGQSSV